MLTGLIVEGVHIYGLSVVSASLAREVRGASILMPLRPESFRIIFRTVHICGFGSDKCARMNFRQLLD